jgi:hypothetical protein
MKGARVRVSGRLGQAVRGPILTTADGSVWVLEADAIKDRSAGELVTVEGVVIGLDKLKVDWVGVAQRDG